MLDGIHPKQITNKILGKLRNAIGCVWLALPICLVFSTVLLSPAAHGQVAIGLDHIPVAVGNLERATATYNALGFTLKPGRDHANGIRNTHVKFPTGAGIELLTAQEAVDELSSHYVGFLRAGEGPAFISFHARDTGRLRTALRSGGYDFRQEGQITKLVSPDFAFLFFVNDNRSPTDQPEHFAHANSATEMCAVWVATEKAEALVRLLVHLGGREQGRKVLAHDMVEATVVTLYEGEVIILPKSYQVISGRPVIGVSFRVRSLAQAQMALAKAGVEPWVGPNALEAIMVEPAKAHGLWLEFRVGPLPIKSCVSFDRFSEAVTGKYLP
jgi:catechol 2,3-dioxygenase-like lactoylglutathione lyase family enzyme